MTCNKMSFNTKENYYLFIPLQFKAKRNRIQPYPKSGIALTQKSCIFTQKKSKKCIFKILMLPGTQDAYLYLIILF